MIPDDFESAGVQLAGQSKRIASTLEGAVDALAERGFYFDLKHDGVRCMALIHRGQVRLINRVNLDISFRYPDIVEALQAVFPDRSMVLDGELIVQDGNGRPDFAAIHRRDAQQALNRRLVAAHPAVYMIFDMLFFEGDDIRPWPYQARRALCSVEAQRSSDPRVQWSVSDLNGSAMWNFVKLNQLEGLIAKDPKGRYRAGDRTYWTKIKQAFTISAIVAKWDRATFGKDRPAYTAGKGRRANGIGALSLTLIRDGVPIEFGEVGTGFTDADLAALKTRIDAGQVLVVDLEIANVTRDCKPRFPSYRGVRMDVLPSDCTVSQLAMIPTS